jgi:Polysaccharide deacetylase
MPGGTETLEIKRPLIGNVTYDGMGVYNCLSDDKIALTFDDGPFNFTWHLLDVLASYGAKATFFITGNNMGKGQIDIEETGYPETIRRMHREGVSVHVLPSTRDRLMKHPASNRTPLMDSSELHRSDRRPTRKSDALHRDGFQEHLGLLPHLHAASVFRM